ncbi:MAG: hypothetical protein M3539_18235 [Acidobacteriota bacterium]|nr:hypothetical protein [Acidobacteriota bacterium]
MSVVNPGNGGDIIIKGGSVDLDYDDAVYPKDSGNPRKHKSEDRTLIRIVVKDGGGATKYDSNNDTDNPWDWEVTTYTKKR